jgi:hypothetical protein
MKHLVHCAICGTALLTSSLSLLSANAKAQITVTQEEFSELFAPDVQLDLLSPAADVQTVDMGLTGPDRIWDFSAMTFEPTGQTVIGHVEDLSRLASRYPAGDLIMGIQDAEAGGEVIALTLHRAASDGLVGTWMLEDTDSEINGFHFFDDGTYAMVELDSPNQGTAGGMEWGSWSHDAGTGLLTGEVLFDSNGDYGLSALWAGGIDVYLEVTGNTCTVTIEDMLLEYTRVLSTGIQGTWQAGSENENDLLALLLLDDGHYVHVEVDLDDPQEISGMEYGWLNRHQADGLCDPQVLVDQNGDTGLSDLAAPDAPFLYLQVEGDELQAVTDSRTFDYTIAAISASSFASHGNAVISPGFEYYEYAFPAESLVPFPLTAESSLSENFSLTDSLFVNGEFIQSNTSSINQIIEVDAWGTLILPDLGSHQCLRLRLESEQIEVGRTWFFLTENGLMLEVDAELEEPMEGEIVFDSMTLYLSENAVDVESAAAQPTSIQLLRNSPNPFNPVTQIEFLLETAGHTRLTVYDLQGRLQTTLVDKSLPAGRHSTVFSGHGLSSGVYIATLESAGKSSSRRMLLIK